MKKLLVILLTVGVVSGAKAQIHGHIGGGGYYGGGFRTGVVVGGYAPYYAYPGAYWGFGLGFPYLYGYPYYGYPYGPYMSRLQAQIEGIKADYADRIESVRMDNTLTGKDRRAQIRQLKKDRDAAIDQAKRDYWKTPSKNGGTPTQSGNGSPANGGTQSNGGAQQGTPSGSEQSNGSAPANNGGTPSGNENQSNNNAQ